MGTFVATFLKKVMIFFSGNDNIFFAFGDAKAFPGLE